MSNPEMVHGARVPTEKRDLRVSPSLPEEMIDLILFFADHATQQHFRLCCRQFNRIATPRYFQRFSFRLSQPSLDGLIKIANNEVLSKYVQELEFNIHQLLWFFDFDHFLRELRLPPGPWHPPPGLKHLSNSPFYPHVLHQIYTHYVAERDTSIYYISLLLSHSLPTPTTVTPNPLNHIYTHLPHAFTLLPNLRTLNVTIGPPPQSGPSSLHHTWRGLTFTPPDPDDPPSDRDTHKAEHLSVLLHVLGRAATLLHAQDRTLPLRTLVFLAVGDSVFGAEALATLWNMDAISPPPPSVNVVDDDDDYDGEEEEEEEEEEGDDDEDEDAFYERQYQLITLPVTHLTTLKIDLNFWASGLGGLRPLVRPLAAFLMQARALRELRLMVESQMETRWRSRVEPDVSIWRGKDILLTLLGENEEEEASEEGREERGVQWPYLEKLSLDVQTSEDGLLGLLERVADTLKSLTLCGVRFMPLLGDWHSALVGMRDTLVLDELNMSWLYQDVTFTSNNYAEILVPPYDGVAPTHENITTVWRETIFEHYESQIVDWVLGKTRSDFILSQDRFFDFHSPSCEWCTSKFTQYMRDLEARRGNVSS